MRRLHSLGSLHGLLLIVGLGILGWLLLTLALVFFWGQETADHRCYLTEDGRYLTCRVE